MRIKIAPKAIFKFLCVIIFMLILLSVISNMIRLNAVFAQRTYVNGLLNLVDLDLEANLPSFYSSCALLLASILLFLIAAEQSKRTNGYYRWTGLAFLFLFLAVDEISEIHEHLIFILQRMFHFTGFFFYAWVIPYTALVLTVIAVYMNFLMKLPVSTRKRMIIAGAIYVCGAIGFEMISGKIAEVHGVQNGPYYCIITLEETFEMLGIALFIYTLLSYIDENFDFLMISLENEKPATQRSK